MGHVYGLANSRVLRKDQMTFFLHDRLRLQNYEWRLRKTEVMERINMKNAAETKTWDLTFKSLKRI